MNKNLFEWNIILKYSTHSFKIQTLELLGIKINVNFLENSLSKKIVL